jgi:hypothetical protein
VFHHWLVALKARTDAGVVLADAGDAEVAGEKVRLSTIWRDGCATTLGLGADGRLLCARYRGRDANLFLADIEERFSDFREVGTLAVPFKVTVFADGAEAASLSRTLTRAEAGAALPDAMFQRPAGGS